MRNHLKLVHHKINLEKDGPSQRQLSLKDMNMSKKELGQDKYRALNRALALAIALDVRPLSLVNGKGFRYFCSLLNPLYKVPCSKTIKANLLHLYEENKKDIIELITNQSVAITTDLWTGVGARSYITITGHFISPNWEYRSIVLATRPLDVSHTAKNISDCLEAIQHEFQIVKLTGLVTDNAANMRLAGTMLGVLHWMCFSHTLQLCIQEGLKIPTIKTAISRGSSLVGHFNKSSTATAALKAKQADDLKEGEKAKALIQSVPTRWNSEYFMAKRLIELRIPVFQVLLDKGITKQKHRDSLELKDSSWKALEDIIPILQPFATATEALTKEDTPTLSQVYILLRQLVLHACSANEDDSALSRKLKATIKAALLKRFSLNNNAIPLNLKCPAMVACFLDPRYKSLKFLSEEQRKEITDYVIELAPTEDSATVNSVQQDEEADACKAEEDFLACLSGDIEIDLTSVSTNASNEVKQYLAEPVRMASPLDWWKANENRYYASKVNMEFAETVLSMMKTCILIVLYRTKYLLALLISY